MQAIKIYVYWTLVNMILMKSLCEGQYKSYPCLRARGYARFLRWFGRDMRPKIFICTTEIFICTTLQYCLVFSLRGCFGRQTKLLKQSMTLWDLWSYYWKDNVFTCYRGNRSIICFCLRSISTANDKGKADCHENNLVWDHSFYWIKDKGDTKLWFES